MHLSALFVCFWFLMIKTTPEVYALIISVCVVKVDWNSTMTWTWHRIDSGCHTMSRDWQRGPSLLPNRLLPNGSGMSVVEIVVEIIKVESTHFNRGWNHSAIFVFSNITEIIVWWIIIKKTEIELQPSSGPIQSRNNRGRNWTPQAFGWEVRSV